MFNLSREQRGIIFTLIGGCCWGFSGTCGQYLFAFEHISAEWLTIVRMLGAGSVLLILLVARRRLEVLQILQDKRDRRALFVFAMLGLLSCQYTYLVAIAYTNAGTATVLQYLGPVFVLAYACFLKKRLPNRRETGAVLLALGGTALIATQGDFSKLAIPINGLIWGLLSAVSLMIYTVTPERIMQRWGSQIVTSYGMLIGGIGFFLLSGLPNLFISLSDGGMLAVMAIVFIGTILSFSLYLQGVADIGSVKASMLACIEPVSATVCSAVWLGTSFSLMDIAGFAMIILTVLILTKK